MKNRLTVEKALMINFSLMFLCLVAIAIGLAVLPLLSLTSIGCLYFLILITFILGQIQKEKFRRNSGLINYDVMRNDQNYAKRIKQEESILEN